MQPQNWMDAVYSTLIAFPAAVTAAIAVAGFGLSGPAGALILIGSMAAAGIVEDLRNHAKRATSA